MIAKRLLRKGTSNVKLTGRYWCTRTAFITFFFMFTIFGGISQSLLSSKAKRIENVNSNAVIPWMRIALRPFKSFQDFPDDFKPKDISLRLQLSKHDQVLLQHFVTDYMDFHSENRKSLSCRTLIFRPHATGIGDRFERLMTAYYVAVVTKRVFLIDWQRPSPIEDFIETADVRTDMFVRHIESQGLVLDKTFKHNPQQFIDTLMSNITVVVMTMTHRPFRSTLESLGQRQFGFLKQKYLTGFYGSHVFRRIVMHLVFRLRSDFDQHISEKGHKQQYVIARKISNVSSSSLLYGKYIGVHARVGLGPGEAGDRFDAIRGRLNIPAKCLARRAVLLAKRRTGHPCPIFLATDTPSFRKIFFHEVERIGGHNITIFHGRWNAVHSYYNIDMENTHLNRSKDEQGLKMLQMMETYADLSLLGRAQHIIALRSSFVRFAFAIGNATSFTQLDINDCIDESNIYPNPFSNATDKSSVT